MDFKDKTLLIIASAFPDKDEVLQRGSFVKYQVDVLKDYFKHICVISLVDYYTYFKHPRNVFSDYRYDNVSVFWVTYLPLHVFRRLEGKNKAIDIIFKIGNHIRYGDITYSPLVRKVSSIIRKANLTIDLIHAHHTQPAGLLATYVSKRYNVPFVLTIHENTLWFEHECNTNDNFLHVAWKNADALIRVNPFDIPILKNYNSQSFFIPNGYSSSFFPRDITSCREKLSLPNDVKIIFGLGILSERKGFQYLIEAMIKILEGKVNVLCYIGGGGPYRQHLTNLISKFHLEKKVFLLGRLSDDELPLWMNATDVFVLPSLGESFGVVNIEALACGTPVVASNVGGIPSIITDDKYGLLAEVGNSDDLAEKIILALEKEWDEDGILRYADRYSWEEVCKEIVGLYNSMILKKDT